MLAEKLYNLNSFQRQYKAILTLSVSDSIDNLVWCNERSDLLNKIDWNNVLSISSALAFSEKNDHLDAALRIAQSVLSTNETNQVQREAAAVILLNLTNSPAVELAKKRNLIQSDFRDHLPFTLKLKLNRALIENSILIKDEILTLNRFQKTVYDYHLKNDVLSVSAPTSAGKSFVLCNIIAEELLQGSKNIIYIVPTRALISQVEKDLQEFVHKYAISDVNISTIPQSIGLSDKSNVFVFTQERLHWFLQENSLPNIDMLFVDEAHKIDDKHRGILLQQKIEELVSINQEIKVFFSSPFTSNPELLLENVNTNGSKDKIRTEFVAVNQNLIYANQVPRKPDLWKLSLIFKEWSLDLGTIKLHDRPTGGDKRKLAFITRAFSNNDIGNVIYSNSPSESENIAIILYELIPPVKVSEEVENLISLVKKTIHSKYRLAKVLKKGIAFHYGNMPLLIRQEIERLFADGHLTNLVCTSTLLEGVNLPAKSIFINKPTRGRGNPLNESDFWNLAGRAGRWGKEFSGNIICIEPKDWKVPPDPKRSKQKITRAVDEVRSSGSELLDFIKSGAPRIQAQSRQDLEFAFGYFYQKYINDQLDSTSEFNSALITEFRKLDEIINVPIDIIKRNPGISPIAQQELLNYFDTKEDLTDLIPVFPEDSQAVDRYIKLVGRIGKTVAYYPAGLHHARSILLINWMTGKPLSFLISKAFEYYSSKPEKYPNHTIHVVIRDVMESVESFVRFSFAKDSACYIDLLRFYLKEQGEFELINDIPELNMWLEFGVSENTQLSLLSLGLSRNTVIQLSEFIVNTNLTRKEALEWIRVQNLEEFDLSPIIMEDINRMLKNV